jgi:Zn-dependent alcohol dehydrogenases
MVPIPTAQSTSLKLRNKYENAAPQSLDEDWTGVSNQVRRRARTAESVSVREPIVRSSPLVYEMARSCTETYSLRHILSGLLNIHICSSHDMQKAIVVQSVSEPVRLIERRIPEPGENQVLVQVTAASRKYLMLSSAASSRSYVFISYLRNLF